VIPYPFDARRRIRILRDECGRYDIELGQDMRAIVCVTREKTESVYRHTMNGCGGSRNQFDKKVPLALVTHHGLTGESGQRCFNETARTARGAADEADESWSHEVKLL
jgi:hypothetical protein